jgi:hypothetical protein
LNSKAILLASALFLLSWISLAVGEPKELPEWDGSRATPVHRIPVFDEDGQQIIPGVEYALPFSARNTCGKCHDYETVLKGWHFNASRDETDSGRPGEPWVWLDEKTGTQIPLSYRGWEGTWHPSETGLTPWKFNQIFNRHLPGGDPSRPGENEVVDPHSRWEVSGDVEINCLGCHSTSPMQDQSEWAKQVARENFRWAATAASGLGEVGGMASRLPDTWIVYDGPDPDDTEWAVAPSVRYDETKFDSKHRAFFDVQHKSPDNNCLYCHSAHQVGTERWERKEDVHTAAGISCVDCHRNGLDHGMVRGYQGEASERQDRTVDEFSCRGCHAGPSAGRLGAPHAKHKGLPLVHFEKMTCTACHSGLNPQASGDQQVRLSRIHRLGIHGKARWFTDLPEIVEPVLARGTDGMIAPHRAIWPAFWARVRGEKVIPIPPDEVYVAIDAGILEAEKQVGSILAALSQMEGADGVPVLLNSGKKYRRNIDGELDFEVDEENRGGVNWAWDREGGPVGLVESFELDEEGRPDYEIESQILYAFEALGRVETRPGEPVMFHDGKLFSRDSDGLLEIQPVDRQGTSSGTNTYPAWGWGDMAVPLVPEHVVRSISETQGTPQVLTDEQVVMVLKSLGKSGANDGMDGEEFGYISGGYLFQLGADQQSLTSSGHDAAQPYLWPVAHEVRPAAQSLGARGCQECHSNEAPFLFGSIEAKGPLATTTRSVKPMHEFQGLDENFQDLLAASFKFRPVYRRLTWAAAGILAGVLLLTGLSALKQLLRFVARRD